MASIAILSAAVKRLLAGSCKNAAQLKESPPTAAGHENSTEKEGRIRAAADTLPLFAKFLCTDGRSALYQRSGSCLAALLGLLLNC